MAESPHQPRNVSFPKVPDEIPPQLPSQCTPYGAWPDHYNFASSNFASSRPVVGVDILVYDLEIAGIKSGLRFFRDSAQLHSVMMPPDNDI